MFKDCKEIQLLRYVDALNFGDRGYRSKELNDIEGIRWIKVEMRQDNTNLPPSLYTTTRQIQLGKYITTTTTTFNTSICPQTPTFSSLYRCHSA